MILKYIFLITLFTGLFTSCSKNKDPEGTLRDFVEYRFSKDQSREGLYKYIGGDFQHIIETMSEDDFKTLLKTSLYRKKKMRVLVKKCEPEKCVITYTLKYEQSSPTNSAEYFEVEVKKIAELTLDEDSWKIVKVDNIKTYLDGKNSPIEI